MKRIVICTVVTGVTLLAWFFIGPTDAKPQPAYAVDSRLAKSTNATSMPTADHPPRSTRPFAPDSNAFGPGRRQYKIDEAVISLHHIFLTLLESKTSKSDLRSKERTAIEEEFRKGLEANQAIAAKDDLDAETRKQLASQLEELRKTRQSQIDRLDKQLTTLQHAIYNRMMAEVVRYAKEKDIRTVKRAKSSTLYAADPNGIKTMLNREVIYDADAPIDITNEILSRLMQPEPQQSKKASDNDPFGGPSRF